MTRQRRSFQILLKMIAGWRKFREWLIRVWHGVLDFDTEIPAKKKAAILKRREDARRGRLAEDAAYDRATASKRYKNEKTRELAAADEKQQQIERARYDAEMRARQPKCRVCSGLIVIHTRTPQGGMGCLLIVIGLCLSPFLIGIPVAIYGIVLTGKTEKYPACQSCGCSG